MFGLRISFFTCILHFCSCDWVSEWMAPIQNNLYSNYSRETNSGFEALLHENENKQKTEHTQEISDRFPDPYTNNDDVYSYTNNDISTGSLKTAIVDTIHTAKLIAETLKTKIQEFINKENVLKDAIVNGRYGVTIAAVSSMDANTKTYIVRDGLWSLCRGVVRHPKQFTHPALYNDDIPQCMGQEIMSQQDPCVFNSVIKYETLPTTRRSEYYEEDFLCLKKNFNNTLERYMSVPRQIINTTCLNGIVRSLDDQITRCTNRMISEYTYYPMHGTLPPVPLEYCIESEQTCKLTVAWHISNSSIENFEFLKTEQAFKKYFLKPGGYIEQLI